MIIFKFKIKLSKCNVLDNNKHKYIIKIQILLKTKYTAQLIQMKFNIEVNLEESFSQINQIIKVKIKITHLF